MAHGTQEELGVVSGHERVKIEVRGETGGLSAALPQGMEVVSLKSAGDGLSEAIVGLGGGEPEALVAAFVEAGLGVRRLEVHRTDLEAVFLELVSGEPT